MSHSHFLPFLQAWTVRHWSQQRTSGSVPSHCTRTLKMPVTQWGRRTKSVSVTVRESRCDFDSKQRVFLLTTLFLVKVSKCACQLVCQHFLFPRCFLFLTLISWPILIRQNGCLSMQYEHSLFHGCCNWSFLQFRVHFLWRIALYKNYKSIIIIITDWQSWTSSSHWLLLPLGAAAIIRFLAIDNHEHHHLIDTFSL